MGYISNYVPNNRLTLCYSATEYACPVWERSCHTYKLNATLNDSCCCITGCLKPTNIDKLYFLAGIAPPIIRRSIASRVECHSQATDLRHMLYGDARHTTGHLHSRHSFLVTALPLTSAEAEISTLRQGNPLHDLA